MTFAHLYGGAVAMGLLVLTTPASGNSLKSTLVECVGETKNWWDDDVRPTIRQITRVLNIFRRPSDGKIVWISEAHPTGTSYMAITPGADYVGLYPTYTSSGGWLTEPPIDADGRLRSLEPLYQKGMPKSRCIEGSITRCAEYSYKVLIPDSLTGIFWGQSESKVSNRRMWSEQTSALCKPLR